MSRRRLAGWVAAVALGLARPASAAEAGAGPPARRGPLEVRDEWLLAQPRLTLPAMSPDPLPARETRLRLDLAWGNDFGWQQESPHSDDLAFLVDGEHRTLSLEVRQGVTPALTVGLRLPLRWRGGGLMDGIIDLFHRVTGLPGGGRASFPADRLRVEGRDPRQRPVYWTGKAGTGLGNAEVLAHWAFRSPPGGQGFAAALVGRAALPTATGTFAGTGPEVGAQLVAARDLHPSVDLYAGLGGTAFARQTVAGIEYARWRGQAFVALEWRPWRRLSISGEVDASSRLVRNLERYPGWQAYFRMGTALELSERWRMDAGFEEGIKSQQATTDFGIVAGLARRF